MFWKFVGYDKDGRTSEEKLAHSVALEGEQQPNETVRGKDLGRHKFPFRWEGEASDGKAEGSALLMHPRLPPSCLGADRMQLCTFVLTQFHYGTVTASFCLEGLFCGSASSSGVLASPYHFVSS